MIILVVGVSAQFKPSTVDNFTIDDNTTLWDVMSKLGKIKLNVVDVNRALNNVDKGKELVHTGQSSDFEGKRVPKLGQFTCISCHTIEKEFDKMQVSDPDKRLQYADSLQLAFLPGTPFYGLVNRIYYFTNDFQKDSIASTFKYKDIIKKSHTDLRTAIQFCNYTYAHGRAMADWEIESILAYLWTLQIKMKDLQVEAKDMEDIQFALNNNTGNAKAVNLLRRYYLETYPAHLDKPLHSAERRRTSPILNNFFNGEKVYERSCLHCHQNKAFANRSLDKDKSSFQYLKKHFDDSTSAHSVYEVHRFSVKPIRALKKSKAPHFTRERMSNQQLQDLRFYITQMLQFGDEAAEYYRPKNSRNVPLIDTAMVDKINNDSTIEEANKALDVTNVEDTIIHTSIDTTATLDTKEQE